MVGRSACHPAGPWRHGRSSPQRTIGWCAGTLVALLLADGGTCSAQQSANYSISSLVATQGGGSRSSANYQIVNDILTDQPVVASSSANYSLLGRPLAPAVASAPTCGIYVNGDAAATNSVDVTLSLICSHPTGCAEMQLSDNGVGWAAATPFAMSAAWTLPGIDGARRVYARFRSGSGVWSGACWDGIVLDTIAPYVTMSPTGGTFMATQSVAVTASEPATIKYTSDGSDPRTSGTARAYTGPIAVPDDATLKAYATDVAGHESPVVSESYEICTGSNLTISGSVLDATRDNAPMPLVVIRLDTGQQATTTPAGTYFFPGLPRGWYTIQSVTAPVAGYVTYQARLKACDASLAHDILLTRDGTTYGTDTNAGYSADGVNTSTGNFAYTISDLALPGPGPSVVFDRTYNSQDGTNGPLGYGWTWNYNISLSEAGDGAVVVRWGDGKTEVWAPDSAGGYTPMYGVFSTLQKNPDTTFTLRQKDLTEYRFNAARRLSAILDEFGNAILFDYAGANLSTITDTARRQLSLSYDGSGRITNVLDPAGRSVSFAYDAGGNLSTATNLAGRTTRYTYDASHRMLSIIDPRGNVALTNSYDSRSAVVLQRDVLGAETRYVYDEPSRTTTIIDAVGTSTAHRFDALLRLVEEVDGLGRASTRAYDEQGSVEQVTDKNGNVTSFTYDSRGNVLTKTEPLGRVTSATYDAASNPVTKTDARGHATVFEYHPSTGALLARYACGTVPAAACPTDTSVEKTAYTYDPLTGQLLTVTEAVGKPGLQRTTTFQYDVMGNRVAVIDALGNTSAFTFDAVGRKLSETHPLGRATAYEYDSMDRLAAVTDALGGQSLFTYDENGNKTVHRDARLNSTAFAYDAADRLTTTTDAAGGIERFGYDALGRRTRVTNQNGAVSTIGYDAVGNVVQETDAPGNVVRHEYDANGNRTATVDERNARTVMTYDALNRLVSVTDPLGNRQTFEYDLNGNRTKVTDALGKVTTFTYDAFNRPVTTTDPLGNTLTNTYDLLGRLVRVRDARGNDTRLEYDLLDRLARVTDAAGGVVTATFDALGNRTSVTDPRGKVTTFAYDVLNRLVSETDPLGSVVTRAYDAVGNLVSLTNADGPTAYGYDRVNRVTSMVRPDSSAATYTYDPRGNRTRVVDPAGATSWTYDAADRVVSVTDAFGNVVGYSYDASGNRSGVVYPGNRRVTYLFDALDRMTIVQDWGGVTTTYAYDAAGRLASQTMGNGAVVTYAYDIASRLVGKQDRTGAGGLIASYGYTLDANGNRTAMDMAQPLLPVGGAQSTTYTYNDGNQLTAKGVTAYTYDGKGNRRTETTAGVTTQYAYDYNNRLTSISGGGSLLEYLYTSDGKRVLSSRNGTQTRYLLDLSGEMEFVLAELTSSNVATRYYIYGDGLLYSVDGATGERLFYHFDPVGSTVAITDASGVVTDSFAYLPFGEMTGRTGPHETPFTYVGKFGVMREGGDLYFMRARFYDAGAGGFIGEDPVRSDLSHAIALNKYTYALDNPLSFSDPKGEIVPLLFVAAVALGYVTTEYLAPAVAEWACGLEGSKCTDVEATKENASTFASIAMLAHGVTHGFIKEGVKGVGEPLLEEGTGWALGQALSPRGEKASLEFPSVDGGESRLVSVFPLVVTKNTQTLYSAGRREASVNLGFTTAPAADSTSSQVQRGKGNAAPPRQYLSVAGSARSEFGKEYRHILAPDFLDRQTSSAVERAIQYEIAQLQRNRTYGYRTPNGKRKALERRARDVAASMGQLYAQLTTALSKHEVLVRDLSVLPQGATGGLAKTGVYAGRQ